MTTEPGAPAGSRPTIVALLGGLGTLTGSGGAERYFAHVLSEYAAMESRRFEVLIAIDERSVARLAAVGERIDRPLVLPLPESGRLMGNLTYALALWRAMKHRTVDLFYVPLVNPRYLLTLSWVRAWRTGGRPRIAINVLDCTLAHRLLAPPITADRMTRGYILHDLYFRLVRPDFLCSPYQLFCQKYRELRHGVGAVSTMQAFCVDFERFAPGAKEDIVVWAGRLDRQKQPLLFVGALAQLRQCAPDIFERWRFEMYGRGPLERRVLGEIARLGLGDRVSLASSPRMDEVFARSRVYVSTQDYENFSSMAMLEAMAAGNAVIARPVGETARWVHHGGNGVLAEGHSADSLGRTLATLLSNTERISAMGAQSRQIAIAGNGLESVMADLDRLFCLALGEGN